MNSRRLHKRKRTSCWLGTAKIVAFCATRDSTRSRAFYEGVLGLTMVEI